MIVMLVSGKHTHDDYDKNDSRHSDNTGVNGTARRYGAERVLINVREEMRIKEQILLC